MVVVASDVGCHCHCVDDGGGEVVEVVVVSLTQVVGEVVVWLC